ncbi:hemagglutinin repeat-containing protein [Pseudomonas paralactis]|uniref:hemagglutinin repeat-containing protein n=1 Tax=Pseudomonas paralactis TaxID=1615673 RepID=UPI0009E992A1|nr:hemagglutinin repeat-containing protein [Pseudomonas paralactis]
MDVRQFAFLVRQPSAALKSRDAFLGLPKRGLALILANALFWQPLLAQAEGIVVSAPGTTVGAAGNGVPVVNIATPNGSGLSHNQFKDYNVGTNGVILNNATERTQSTQLGGIILGNPNLQGRAANIILNEVNGGSPSQLRGYTEVAGQSAKVIVANPYGITCSGCGFINTPNVTLTTGKPILDNGRLDRYQVDGGAVTVDGTGLDAGDVDRFEIITRSARINAQINARNLSVVAGRNDVNAQTLSATARADDGSAKPELAIDSTALGGMYAGAIKLVGTEAGVGVKLDGGLIASGGDIQLDASGHLRMAEARANSGAINIKAASVQTQGHVHAGTTLDVQSLGDLNNQGKLSARDRVTLSSGGQLTNRGIIESGINPDLIRNAIGDLSLSAQVVNNSNGGSVVASRNLTVTATQALNNQGGTLSATKAANVSAGTLDNQNKGRVLSKGSLELNASQLLNAQGGLVNSSGPLTATVGQLSNRSGEVSSMGAATLNIATLDNVAGLVNANQGLRITASGAINNQGGKLTSLDTLNLTAKAVDNSAAGRITSTQALTANVASLNNNAGHLTSTTSLTLDVNKGQLNNQKGLVRGPTLVLNNLADVDNQGGEISSTQGFSVTAKNVNNSDGKLLSEQGLTLRLDGVLTNTTGEVASAHATELHATSLDNTGGKVTGDTGLTVDVSGALNNRQGVLRSGQAASISAASLDNSHTGKVISDTSLTTRIAGLLDNQSIGLLSAKGVMDVRAGSLDNRGGSLSGKDLLTLTTASLDNRGGNVSADKDMQLNVASLNNQGKGLLVGQAAVRYQGTTLSNQGGLLSAVGPVRLDATTVENASGRISSKGDLIANVTHFNQQKGELVASGTMMLTGSTLDNSNGGTIGATQALTLTVDDINNQAGAISSAIDVNLAGTYLNNSRNGKLLAGTDLGLKVAQVINQSEGLLFGNGKVTLQGKSLDNSGGTVSGVQGLTLTHSGDVDNTSGLLTSESGITATTGGLNNTSGKVSSTGAVALSATGALTNHNGAVTTDKGLTLNSASLENRSGTLSAKGAVKVTTGAFNNTQAGSLISEDTLTLTAGQVSNGVNSRIVSDNALTASVTGFDQQGGKLTSVTSLSLDLNNGQLNNQQGMINAPLLVLKNLNGVNNQNGEISSTQAFTLASKSLDNSNGKLISNQALTLRIDQAISNIKGKISAAALQINGASLDNSEGMLSSRGQLTITVDGVLKNQDGTIVSDAGMKLTAASLENNDGEISSKGDLTADITNITNQNGKLIAQGALSLDGQTLDNRQKGYVSATQKTDVKMTRVDNRGGEISSKAAVQITGQHLDNSDGGLVLAATDLTLNVDDVLNRNKGQLSGQNGVTLEGTTLDNSDGSLISQTDLGLELSGELNNNQGRLSSEGLLTVDAGSLNNRKGKLSSAGALDVTAHGAVDNQGGEMVTDAGLTLNSTSLDNSQKGTLSSKSALVITTGAFDNSHSGNVSTRDTLNITAGQLTNHDAGRLTSEKALTANVTGLDQQGGKLFSNTSVALDLKNGQLNNQGGLINGPLLMLKNLKGVNNQGGEISSAQAFTLTADSLDNSSGKLLSYQALTLRITQALNNVKGLIAAQSVDGRAATLDNSGGTLTSRGDTLLNVDGQLTNQDKGLINAANALTLNSAGVNNQGGSVLGKSIAIDLGGGDLNNTKGLITTEGQLTIKRLRDLSNQNGEISTAQNLTLNGRTLDNSAGKLISNTVLTLDGTQLTNQGGLISGWQGVSVNGVDLDNRNQGTVSSRFGNVDATLSNNLLNSGAGALVSQKALTVKADSLDNSDKGILSSAGGQTLTVTGVLNNAQGGLIDSGAALDLNVHTLNNAGGTVNAQQALSLIGTSLDNSAGNLIGNGSVTLDLLGALTNTDGKLASAGALLLKRATEVNNQGGQLVSQSLLTLFAGSLDNRKRGTVASNGTLLATTTGAIQNDGDGLIYSQNADLKLKAASLDNAKGSIQSQTALNLDITGALDNQSGKVIAQNGAVDIKATTIDNRGGTLASLKGTLQAKALGGWLRNDFDLSNNRQAGIIQAQSLILTSASLNNNGGRIAAQTGDTDVTTGAFDNRDGGLYAKGMVKVIGNSFDNSGDVRGQVAGGQVDLKLSGGALNNQKGIIESDTTLKVAADSVHNQGGQLRALGKSGKTDFQIGGVLDNRNGTLETANSDLTLNAGSFQNTGGSVLHVGTGTFDISTANLTNVGGNVVTRGGLTLTADDWTNSSVIQAGRLTVNVNTLNQTAEGQLLASDSLVGKGINWSNDGLIASDGSLNVTLDGTYSGSGRMSSLGDLSLSAAQLKLSKTTSIAGGGNATANISGSVDNQGRLTATKDLNLTAGAINNYGTLGSGQKLTATTGALLNDHALIFSGSDMSLRVDSLSNSYADIYSLGDLSIDREGKGGLARSIINSSSTIQSDGNLSLAASTIKNIRAVLNTSNQDIYTARITEIACIAGYDCDGGKENHTWEIAQREKLEVIEASAASSITSGGNMDINAGDLSNQSSTIAAAGELSVTVNNLVNSGLETGDIETTRVFVSERTRRPGRWYDLANAFNNKYWFQSAGYTPNDLGGLQAAMGNFIAITGPPVAPEGNGELPHLRTTKKLADGDQRYAAVIQAGGAVNVTAGNNIDSSVVRPGYTYVGSGPRTDTNASGAGFSTRITLNQQLPPDLAQQQVNPLSLPGFSLPTGQNGLFRLSGQGASTPANQGPQSWTMGGASIDTAQRDQGVPARGGREVLVDDAAHIATATQAPVSTADLATSVAGIIEPLNVVPIVAPLTDAVVPDRSRVDSAASTTPVESLATAADTLTVNRVQGLPDGSYVSNPQKYLIETNPALTDLKQFMSSDYLLSKLGYNPDTSWKRLGDGLYEDRLIQQAIIARTGQRFLDGQTSDAGQYKYLMDNAIASKQRLNLAVGVSLTAEQVAALTHDIVWMESATVNGESVLAPVLYLAQANNRLGPNGALIAGSDVNLIAGENLNNVGTLRATNNLSATAGANLVNSGLIEAGHRLDLLAGNNLINKAGGIISGRDVSLTAVNGDLINERTVTRHESSNSGYRTERMGFVDSAARIEAANNLSMQAGRDVNSVGGVLKSGADTTIKAGRDVNLIAAEQRNAGVFRDSSVTQYGNMIEAGRDFRVQSGRDISAIASQIEAKRDIAMAATGDLTLASGANEQHSSFNSKKVKSQEDHVQQVSTTVKAGGDVALSAGEDMALIASRVTAGDEAYLYARENIELKSAENEDYSFYSKTKKSSSGKKFRLDETDSTTNVGSLVESGGNSTVVAGKDLLLAGSAVAADKGAAKLVAGEDVQILAVTDSDSARHERKQSKSSWGGFKSSKVKDKVDETRTTAVGSMVSGETVSVAGAQDVTVTGSALVSTGDLTVQAGRDLTIDAAQNTFSRTDMHKEKNRDLTGVLTGNKLGLDDITGNQHLFINSQKHNGTAAETTLTGSTVGSSAGNVTLEAGRELKVVASDLVSTKDMSLNGANVTIAAGTETANQTSKDSSKSLAVGRVIGGTMVDTVKSIRNDVRAAQQADDSRLKAVKGAQALLSAYGAMSGDNSSANESDGKPANSKGSVIKIGTELASTRKKSTSEYDAETVKQSSLNSGGSLAIVATGNAPATQGDIHVIGSSIKAKDTLLLAKNDITLESAQDRKNWDNQNSNNKTSIGASFNIGDQNGFTLDLGAKTAKGMGTGHEVTQVNSTVDTGLLVLKSGQDTTLAGAQVRAEAIKADIGGNLNIASRQDEASQKNKQTSAGVGASICVPPFCWGSMVTASGNIAGSKMNSDYKAVTDQTGLFAGSGGYDINTGKNTTLEGAVIASEASADKNHLSTERLLVSDIKNKSDIKSQAASLSLSYTSTKWDKPGGPKTPDDQRQLAHTDTGGAIPLMLKESDSSKTRSAVSPGTIVVRDAAGVNDLVGLNRDTVNANDHLDRPDEKAMQERIDLIQSSAQLSSSVIGMVSKAKADEANKLRKQADAQANAGSPEAAGTARAADAAYADAQRWQVGGDKKMMADIASGLVAAGLGGAGGSTAVGIVANTSSSDIFNKIGSFADEQKNRKDIDSVTKAAWEEGGAARVLLHALAGAAIGLSSGSVQSGALGAGASAALLPSVMQALADSKMSEADQKAVASLIAAGVGTAVGSSNGVSGSVVAAGTAVGVEKYNRQLHPDEIKFASDNDRVNRYAKEKGITDEQARIELLRTAAAMVDRGWNTVLSAGDGNRTEAASFLRAELLQSKSTNLFQVSLADYNNERLGLSQLMKDRKSVENLVKYIELVDPYKYLHDPKNQAEILNAKGQGSAEGFANAVEDLASLGSKTALWAMSTVNCPSCGGRQFIAAVEVVQSLPEELRLKGYLDTLHIMQGYGADVLRQNEAIATSAGVGIGLGGAGVGGAGGATTRLTGELAEAVGRRFTGILNEASEQALIKSGGIFDPDGKPMMDLGILTREQKGVMGDLFGERSVQQMVPEGQKLARVPGVGETGVDDLYKVNRPDVDFVIIEYKFVGDNKKSGSSGLGNTQDGKQGSIDWTLGGDRLVRAVGRDQSRDVRVAAETNRTETWVVRTRPDGSTEIEVLDARGKVKDMDTSKILPSKNLNGVLP